MKMELRLETSQEPSEVTVDLTPFVAEDDDPTVRLEITKSDAIWEAQERARVGSFEAAGFWLMMAGEL